MLYLMRHGQTVWNQQGRKQGQLDSPLTLTGITQAITLGGELGPKLKPHFKIYCSPLGRAKQYAALVLEKVKYPFSKVIFDDLLKECNYANWEGLTDKEIDALYPGERERRRNDHWNHRGHGGESYGDIYERAKLFLLNHRAEDAAIFCHEMISTALRGHLFGWSEEMIMRTRHPQNIYFAIQSDGQCEARKFCK